MKIQHNTINPVFHTGTFWMMRFMFIWTLAILQSSCEEFVDIDPPTTQIVGKTVFESEGTATAALTAIYSRMVESPGGALFSLKTTILTGLSADELVNHSTTPTRNEFYNNALIASNNEVLGLWSNAYVYIYQSNAVLNGLNTSTMITPSVNKQLKGEALFIRAISHFYLVNLFGDIPYVTTTDFNESSGLPRQDKGTVFLNVIKDLLEAADLLGEEYQSSGRARPNAGAARALLAKVYLYNENWQSAEVMASTVIDNTLLYSLEELTDVFSLHSAEAIWQISPVVNGYNTWEGLSFILTGIPNNVSLREELLEDFEENDKRKDQWISFLTIDDYTYYYPYKYKIRMSANVTEYTTIMRLGEQYLIRAEANANLGKLTDAIRDIDMLRARAGLPLIQETNPSIEKDELIRVIEQERRLELFAEIGNRWFDLKRTGRGLDLLTPIKPSFSVNDELYPIPQSQILNSRMNQNPGY